MLDNDYNRNGLKNADTIESVICLAVLIAKGKLNYDQTILDASLYWESVKNDCSNCEYNNTCLACIINE
jgi:hypothetical protein